MLDRIEEKDYENIRKLGQKLHIPIPEAFWEFEVFDKDGRLIQKHHQRSHSWVRNAYNFMFYQLAHTPHDIAKGLNFYNTAGGSQTAATQMVSIGWTFGVDTGYWASAGVATHGIVVGSNDAVESFEHYSLQTQILNGTGANQLSHIASETPVISTVGTTKKAELVRYFNNNSGGIIDVKEVGLYAYIWRHISDNQAIGFQYIMMSRDKLGVTVTIPNTGQLKVTYTLELTYPA